VTGPYLALVHIVLLTCTKYHLVTRNHEGAFHCLGSMFDPIVQTCYPSSGGYPLVLRTCWPVGWTLSCLILPSRQRMVKLNTGATTRLNKPARLISMWETCVV
jgi:hypothetical protein